ncbi:hypothetical protein [Streptomyces sp. NPDC058086]|uniref:ISAzo13-like element transposase-related protein n=1 Tax=Streptomyces sp. NPDC058086 TaxID=3346334 RepID=UPI0036EE3936
MVNSIAATRTRTGLHVHAELDTGTYPVGISVSREHLRSLLGAERRDHQPDGPLPDPVSPHPHRHVALGLPGADRPDHRALSGRARTTPASPARR